MSFGKLLTAMVTPFNQEGEVDYNQAQKLAEYLLENGNDGVVVAGTTGESPTLSFAEKVKLFKAVKEAVGNRGVVIAGTGSNNTAGSVELTREAEKAGVDAIMLVAPYYNKPSQDGLYAHFKTIANATELPIMLYNIPGRSAINILPETQKNLAEIENIVAVKEASGDLNQVSRIKAILPSSFAIYSGDDALTLPLLALGGAGTISVAAHIVGKEMKKMIEAFLNGDLNKAVEINVRLYPVFQAMFMNTNPIPVKTAVNLLGIKAGELRLPMVSATDEEKNILKDLLISLGKIS